MNSKGRRKFLNVCLLAVGSISLLGTGRALHAQPQIQALVNAASGHNSLSYGVVGGGEYSLYGTFTGATLSNTTVSIGFSGGGSVQGVLSYAGSGQINFQIPWLGYWYELTYVDVSVTVNGVGSNSWYPPAYEMDPSLYGCTYTNPWVEQYPSYSIVGDCGYPAIDQSSGPPILIFYGNTFWDGQINCSSNCNSAFIEGISFTAGNVPGTILGVAAFSDGEWQVNVELGSTLPAGSQPVVLTINETPLSFNLTFN